LVKTVIGLVIGMALMTLTQYSVMQAPHGFNADAFGYLCYYTVSALDHLTVGLHLGGLRGAQVAANVIALLEVGGIVAFIVRFAIPGEAIRDLPSRQEILRTVPAHWGWDKIAVAVLVPLIAVGAFYVFGLEYFIPSTGLWVPSMYIVAIATMLALGLLVLALKPRSNGA
jgi:hypothetical protein